MARLVLFVRAVVVLAASRLLLGRRGTTGALRRLGRPRARTRHLDTRRALWAVRRAGQVVGGACLEQSVALTALLQRDGQQPVLILGCSRTADGSWTAHAWVEVAGEVLEPVKGSRHARLACLQAEDGWVPSAPPS